jgi:hypothetical protein
MKMKPKIKQIIKLTQKKKRPKITINILSKATFKNYSKFTKNTLCPKLPIYDQCKILQSNLLFSCLLACFFVLLWSAILLKFLPTVLQQQQ